MRGLPEDKANFEWWVFGTSAFGHFIPVIGPDSVLVALPTIAKHYETVSVVKGQSQRRMAKGEFGVLGGWAVIGDSKRSLEIR